MTSKSKREVGVLRRKLIKYFATLDLIEALNRRYSASYTIRGQAMAERDSGWLAMRVLHCRIQAAINRKLVTQQQLYKDICGIVGLTAPSDIGKLSGLLFSMYELDRAARTLLSAEHSLHTREHVCGAWVRLHDKYLAEIAALPITVLHFPDVFNVPASALVIWARLLNKSKGKGGG